jgi:hypothetical protein
VGGLFSYGVTNYSTDNMSGDSHDWRVGAYVDHKNGNWDYQGLVTTATTNTIWTGMCWAAKLKQRL